MSSGNNAGFLSEVFHLDVDNHVASDKRIANWNHLLIVEDLKGCTYVLHFLGNGIVPKGIAIGCVKEARLLGRFGQKDTELVRTLQVTGMLLLHKGNNG